MMDIVRNSSTRDVARRISTRAWKAVVLASVLALAACGGGGGGDSSSGSPPPTGVTPPPVTPTPPVTPPPEQLASVADATRLLDQASFGPTDAAVADVRSKNIAGWIDGQLATPATGYAPVAFIDPNSAVGCGTGAPANCFRDNYTAFPLQLQFYVNAVNGADQLRQRVALAYSQIFVISSIDIKETYGMREYQQMLLNNAFSNFRVLLERVTLSPAMGDYLDMVNNDKTNAARGTTPNENYGREILQLFSIGLFKLNPDGSVKNDAAGAPIPSYSQDTVEGFSFALTGWTYAPRPSATSKWVNPKYYFGDMVPFADHHETGAKLLLEGVTLPAGQTPQQDLAGALDNIVANPNVGPFIGRRLIEALVTSNPSPQYIARITAVFNNNGQGVRGDMRAVVRAILLDTEARGDAKTEITYGRLREPVQFVAGVGRALGAKTDGVYLTQQASAMGQSLFTASSVFNFYPPDFPLPGSSTLVGPQFGLADAPTSDARLNFLNAMLYSVNGIAADGSVANAIGTKIDLANLQGLAGDATTLVNKLDTLLDHTTMTTTEKSAVATAVNALGGTDTINRARAAAYLVIAAPRYQIAR